MSGKNTWTPILAGELAEEAWRAIDAVAEEVAALTPQEGPRAASFAGGAAGLATLFAYLATVKGEAGGDALADRAVEHLDQASESILNNPTHPGLYSGFTGVAWTAEHLAGWFFEDDGDEEGEDGEESNEIDDALVSMLDGRPWSGDYDLIIGLTGFAVYALEALPRPSARRLLELVIEKLDDLAVVHGEGRTWFTPPELLSHHQIEAAPNGYYNVGVAHGMPAVLTVLALAIRADVAADRARALLEDGARWLLSQQLPAGSMSVYPSWVIEDTKPTASRLAWCYGDVGLAVTLLWAARLVERRDWEDEALRIARACAARSFESSQVRDCGICHGAAGLGHLFNRLYQATGEDDFARAARFWFEYTLAQRQPGQGFGGFRSWSPDEDEELDWRDDEGFLTGSAGIALALLAAVSDLEPAWDRILLTAVPPRFSG